MLWVVGLAAAGGLVAYLLFCRIEARQPLRELMYELRLRGMDLRALDRRAAAAPRSDVTVGLTTIPSRAPHLVPTVKSLLNQTVLPRRVVVHIPDESRREGTPYEVPPDLLGLEVVEVVRGRDWGPATKILPLLTSAPPDARIVSVDDDRIYRPHFLEDLVAASDADPDAAVGCCGLRVPLDGVDRRKGLLGRTVDGLRFGRGVSLRGSRLKKPLPVDVLHGYGGVLLRPRFFDLATLADMDGAPPAAWTEDDTWFAAHCHAPKYIVPGRPGSFPRFFRRRHFHANPLGRINRRTRRPEERNTTVLQRMYADRWTA